MGTRATIEFKDEWDTFYIYRHCDGFPENILADINATIDKSRGRWSGSEAGRLLSLFIMQHGDMKQRLQDYEITTAPHGDESYLYSVTWGKDSKRWVASVK